MTPAFAQLRRVLRETSGMALDDDKRYLVEDRLRDLLRDRGFSGLDQLAQALAGGGRSDLARAVAETLTINETSFFRDRGLFRSVGDVLVPRLLDARRDRRHLRIWCAGCSTGQEPYSLAMTLADLSSRLAGWQVEIVATDLSRSVVETARIGAYSQFEVQRGLPVTLLLRHFHRHGDSWRISDDLRARVQFRTQNLLAIPTDMGRFDLVFCRNVLLYFDGDTKRRVLSRLVECVAPDGFIVLGGAERAGGATGNLLIEGDVPFVFRVPERASTCDARRVSA